MTQITHNRLLEVLRYDADTGVFTWVKPNSRGQASVGQVAGTRRKNGYFTICIDCRKYLAHRLAWLYVYGEWPSGQVDHINRDKSDNRIANLRDVSNSENQYNSDTQRNNTSGVRGVTWHKQFQKWQAQIHVNGRCITGGRYSNLDDAVSARKALEARYGVSDLVRLEQPA